MSRLVQNSREKVLCPVFTCKGSGKSKCIYSFLLIVSSKCSNGAVIEGWRIKATKYTSTNTMSFASSAAPGIPQAGLSSLGHLLCIQSITKESCVTAQDQEWDYTNLLSSQMTSQPSASMHLEVFGDALVLVGSDIVMANFPSCVSTHECRSLPGLHLLPGGKRMKSSFL